MALVAYDNSDSSEYEDEENDNAVTATIVKEPQASSKIDDTPENTTEATESAPNLFNLLPQPSKKKPAVVEEDDEFLHKKEKVPDVVKPRAKITVPSLSDFKDVESPTLAVKPKPIQGKKSGLLGMLPKPRNGLIATTTTKTFIPYVLSQASNDKKKVLQSSIKKPKVDTKPVNDSDESDNEVENDFFSINKPIEVPIVDMPLPEEEIREDISQNPGSRLESYFKKDSVENEDIEAEHMESYDQYNSMDAGASHNGHVEESTSSGAIALDEEAILKLCGSRGKRKREDIQIVDINQQEVLAEAKEWLLKGLMDDTSKRVSSSKRRGNEPTSQQKRKHQITYLAHQAKANEAELQNQWANSRMSRRQTQNKYGF